MPHTPDDEKTLAVPSSALLDDGPGGKDRVDEELTQKFAFDARELDAIGALEEEALSIPVTVEGPTPRQAPFSRDVDQAAPTTRSDRSFTPSGPRRAASPASPPPPEAETVAPGSGRRSAKGSYVATLPVASGMKSPFGAPPPPVETAPSDEASSAVEASPEDAPAPGWLVGYVVTCLVLTLMGLAVLWFEHKTLGHLLP